MKQNKICFFNTTKAWGGGEKWHLDVSMHLSSKGYDVFVVCSTGSDLHEKISKTDVRYFNLDIGRLSYLNPFKLKKLITFFKNERVDTIVMNLSSDVKLAAHAAKKAGVNRIIYRRGSAIPLKNSFYNRYIFKHWVTEILANSVETKKTINRNNPNLFPEEKITVIYNGIDTAYYSDCKKQKSKNKIILGNVARLEHQKGHKYLISIARTLLTQEIDFELHIAGKGSLQTDIEKQIDKYNLTNHVKLLGHKDDVKLFLKDIDIFLLSSLWEGFGYVIAEAMSCSKPVVAFDISSNSELIVNGITGFTVPLHNTQEFVNKIIMLSQNNTLCTKMGIEARKRAVKMFDIKVSLHNIERYLTEQPDS